MSSWHRNNKALRIEFVSDRDAIHKTRLFFNSIFVPLLYDELSRSLEEFEKRTSRACCSVFCMFDCEEIVSSMQVEWQSEYVHVNLFGVREDFKGIGIPKQMVSWLEEQCRVREIYRIEADTLEEWQTRHRYYERWLGFSKGEAFVREGMKYRKFI
jgi:GNAT superfamily N-acetyltransferase